MEITSNDRNYVHLCMGMMHHVIRRLICDYLDFCACSNITNTFCTKLHAYCVLCTHEHLACDKGGTSCSGPRCCFQFGCYKGELGSRGLTGPLGNAQTKELRVKKFLFQRKCLQQTISKRNHLNKFKKQHR